MEYTIKELAEIAGTSTRALRYYDQIALLHPLRITEAGYRIYGENEVDRLQRILFYRALEFPLKEIAQMLRESQETEIEQLRAQRLLLRQKQQHLAKVLQTMDKTIEMKEGGKQMSTNEKFEGLKQRLVDNNTEVFGEEAVARYGKEVVQQSNEHLLKMSEEEHNEVVELEARVIQLLTACMQTKELQSTEAEELVATHKAWLTYMWGQSTAYTAEKHKGIASMYVADERFTAYYDERVCNGAAEFLRDAINLYV